jgi:hypothetical protein
LEQERGDLSRSAKHAGWVLGSGGMTGAANSSAVMPQRGHVRSPEAAGRLAVDHRVG